MKSPLEIGDVVKVKKPILRHSYAGISWDKRVMGRYVGRIGHVVDIFDLPHQHDAYVLSVDGRRVRFGGEDVLWIPHWLEHKALMVSDPTPAPSRNAQAASEIVQAKARLEIALDWLEG